MNITGNTTTGSWENEVITYGRCSLCNGTVVGPRVVITDDMGHTNDYRHCTVCGAVPRTKYRAFVIAVDRAADDLFCTTAEAEAAKLKYKPKGGGR